MSAPINTLTIFLQSLDLAKRNLVRQNIQHGGLVDFFSLYDLKGSPHIQYSDVYEEVYFLTESEKVYKISYENKQAFIFNYSTHEKKILDIEAIFFNSGYTLRIGERYKISLLNYTDNVIEIAPYFYYFNTGYSTESTEVMLLRKIESQLDQLNKKK